MFKIQTFAVVGLLAAIVACAPPPEEEVVFVDPEPEVVPEPVFDSKFR